MSLALTVADLRREMAAKLASTSASAALDARLLVAHALGFPPNDVILREQDPVEPASAERARAYLRRRAAGEPVARIVGERVFYGLNLLLSPETLVPRPDTETLVDAVLAAVARDRAVSILDLGTGSGAIVLALLAELPNAIGVGVDLSAGALAMAARNAERAGLAARVRFREGNWAEGIGERFDVVVANPPYIASAEIADLPVDVRDYDPHLALDGGADGLDAVRAILADLDRVLAKDSSGFVEIGFGQSAAMAAAANRNGFATSFRRDLAGIERVAVISRQMRVPADSG